MANANVPVTAGSGTNIDTFTAPDGDHRQIIIPGDSVSANVQKMSPGSQMLISLDPFSMLYDGFTTIDTTNTWTTGGTVPTATTGTLSFNAGTAANASSYLSSQNSFKMVASSFIRYGALVTLLSGAETGSKAWWGVGSIAASPTEAIPLANGCVFETVDSDGSLVGAIYSGTVRTASTALVLPTNVTTPANTTGRPNDGAIHRYAVEYRASRVYFTIDDIIMGSVAAPNPQVVDLPWTAGIINGSSTLGSARTFTISTASVGSSGAQSIRLSDATYPWRQATVSATGQVSALSTLTSASGLIGARPDGFLNVKQDPSTLLLDTFETLDTTNTWTLGGLTVPTGATGTLTVNPTTAAAGSSWAKSQPTFVNAASSYLQMALIVTHDASLITGNTRWWGLGIPQATPTTGVPCTNGVVFEIRAADGLLYGSVYSATALSQSVALTRQTDGAAHRYQIQYRSSRAYFNIDGVDVGSIAYPITQVAALPLTIGSVNGGSTVTTTLSSTVMGVSDTGKNATQLADGTYPWRKLKIDASGYLYSRKGAAATGTNTSVAGTVSASTTILAANVARLGATVFNDSTSILYLSLGATCTTTNFTVKLAAGAYYELPNDSTGWVGIITGTWATATGNARVTELTA